MKTLSIKQPWAYLICAGIKDIENRTWKCPQKYIGQRVLIHTGVKPDIRLLDLSLCTKEQWDELTEKKIRYIVDKKMPTSAIIGSVEIVDCAINHPSIWAEKTPYAHLEKLTIECQKPIYNWVVADPILFDKPILNVKGRLGLWESEYEEILATVYGKIKTICIHKF